ncbi:MAG: hypothetical protein JRI55_10940 [Deltaproteobacteria bacterium]|jgi:hypothetical protein|nr:hypothetical protein [Deltaproteobacteria bacterium]
MSTERHSITPRAALIALAGALTALGGCDDRSEVWDASLPQPNAFGLQGAVALIDAPAERLLLMDVTGDLELQPAAHFIGPGFATAKTTPDGHRLLVLSRGVVPRRTAEDDPPSLALFQGIVGNEPGPTVRYQLTDPLSGLAVDPESRYAVIYPSAADTSAFLQNPNELAIVDLNLPQSAANPHAMTLRSFGGRPQGFTFTPNLLVPGGARRLLVVQTDRDVGLIDLDHLDLPEITVRLTGGPEALVPGGVAVSDGAPERNDDARIAIRVQNDPNVVLVDLLPVPPAEADETPQSFRALPNVVFVGGVPSDISFVQTDGGLRLAALVPSRGVLTLVDPMTGIAGEVALGAPFERMSLITSIVGSTAEGSDVALLWSSFSPDVAFVALGSTVGKPYKAVERLALEQPVGFVQDVPEPNEHLKILTSTNGQNLLVLDLLARTAAPIQSASPGTIVSPAPDGTRAWIHASGSWLAQLDLTSLHPRNIALNHSVHSVFDVARADGAGRALVAIHPLGGTAATVLDAHDPSLTTAREYVGLLLGELP